MESTFPKFGFVSDSKVYKKDTVVILHRMRRRGSSSSEKVRYNQEEERGNRNAMKTQLPQVKKPNSSMDRLDLNITKMLTADMCVCKPKILPFPPENCRNCSGRWPKY